MICKLYPVVESIYIGNRLQHRADRIFAVRLVGIRFERQVLLSTSRLEGPLMLIAKDMLLLWEALILYVLQQFVS